MDTILYCLAAAAIGFILAWVLKKKDNGKVSALEAQISSLQASLAAVQAEKQYVAGDNGKLTSQLLETAAQLKQAEGQVTAYTTRIDQYKQNELANKQEKDALLLAKEQAERMANNAEKENHSLKTELQFTNQQLSTQKQQLEEIGKQFTHEFQVLAQNILEEKTRSFNSLQEKSLADLLTPLKDNIQTFKTEFEHKYTTESNERISLREQIKHMMELNQTLSKEANSLTSALRGQVKQQGNWGEMILESILEFADLQKGIHYFVQERSYGEEGQGLQPDVIVRYPDGRSIVIDSKVSLLHYEQYCSAQHKDQQDTALQLLLGSLNRHIDGLSGKEYPDAVGALDFVMLFVPVEGAYITILQANPSLWQYAYKKRVLLISPTNLIAAMKLVYDLWKRDGINQNAEAIAEKAVKIYEKLAAFIEDFEKVGTQLERTTTIFLDAKKKLHTGRGNVLSQAHQMKNKLGHNKPNRELPAVMVEEALGEEDKE